MIGRYIGNYIARGSFHVKASLTTYPKKIYESRIKNYHHVYIGTVHTRASQFFLPSS